MATRRSRTAVLLATVLLAPLALAQAPQATIRVEVVAEDGPLAEAVVATDGNAVRTGPDGIAVFTASVDVARIVNVRVSKDGYFPATASVTVDTPKQYDVRVELQRQEEEHEEITVSASRTGARVDDSPVHVEIVQREEIDEETSMRPGDMVMLLNEMGGMRVQTTSPSLGAASVRMQGMLGRYTSFLSDGLPLFGQQGAGLGLLQIPPIDLARVEVIKGNASALYGSSAMAGVVDLISRRPEDSPVREFLLNRSSLGATDGSAFLAGKLSERWGASLLAGGNAQTRADVDGDGWADLAGYARGVVRPHFFWDDQRGDSAMLTGGVTIEDRDGGSMPGQAPRQIGHSYVEALQTRRYDLGTNLQWLLASKLVAAVRASVSEQQHVHTFGETVEHDRHELAFVEASLRGTVARNTWVVGAAAQRDAYVPTDVPRFAYTYKVPGVFVQDDFAATSWLSLSGSARLDAHNVYGTFFSPRLSALVRRSGWTSRWSVGRGFFAPTALTEETEAAGLTRLNMPRPLVAERGRSASADVTRSLGPLTATATLFASNVDHPVYVDRTGVYRIVNLGGPRKNRGAEFLATWRKNPLAATLSYSYVRASELDPSGVRGGVPLTPRHSVGLVGMWEKEGKAKIGVEGYYTGIQTLENNPYRGTSRPYVLVGAMAEKTISPHARLFLNLENLTDVRQTGWDPLLAPQRSADGRWTVDAWAPLEGRVVNGGVKLKF